MKCIHWGATLAGGLLAAGQAMAGDLFVWQTNSLT